MLQSLGFMSSGTYRCEVIAEAPVFLTKLREGNMTVIGEEWRDEGSEGSEGSGDAEVKGKEC